MAAGYEVVTTASPRNFDHVRAPGASLVYDYRSPSVVPDVVAAFNGRTLAGAIALGETGASPCIRVVGNLKGNRFVSIATPPVSFATLADGRRGPFERSRVTLQLVRSHVGLQLRSRTRPIGTGYIFGTALKATELSSAIYRDFLPRALAEGRYLPTPEPLVVGAGVEAFQHAMDVQLEGVSAAKVVVTLP